MFIDRFKTWLKMLHMSEEEVRKHKEQAHDFYGFMAILWVPIVLIYNYIYLIDNFIWYHFHR
jgi:hypothetical protein